MKKSTSKNASGRSGSSFNVTENHDESTSWAGGDPENSRCCHLIAMASQGRRGVVKLMMGHQTHKVVTHSPSRS